MSQTMSLGTNKIFRVEGLSLKARRTPLTHQIYDCCLATLKGKQKLLCTERESITYLQWRCAAAGYVGWPPSKAFQEQQISLIEANSHARKDLLITALPASLAEGSWSRKSF
ncbi:hypothetical protein Nepgr_022002 [Nepenthes gracilis]|uniref:Uncharacterized protein n=1 Tax=Nepenthes gracilis TaxID=150966 RepID=A0AAD3XXY7_NEPGR|nr:hypothetical protein Nepgr_022002 [Nepenthes gracilis]